MYRLPYRLLLKNSILSSRNARLIRINSKPLLIMAKHTSLTPKKLQNENLAIRTVSTDSNHSTLWKVERLLSGSILAVLPLSFIFNHSAMDYLLAASLALHVHWGIEAITVDYIRPSIFGPVIPKIAVILVYILSSLALSGLFYFNYTDVGLTHAIRMILKM